MNGEGEGASVPGTRRIRHRRPAATSWALLGLVAIGVAGCASDNTNGYGDPGARPLPQGYTCQGIKSEMARLDARGVRSAIEARQGGAKLSGQRAADADRYNQLLNYYLGSRCHMVSR